MLLDDDDGGASRAVAEKIGKSTRRRVGAEEHVVGVKGWDRQT